MRVGRYDVHDNGVEKLRALCFDAKDFSNFSEISEKFSEIEIKFMEQFKRVYELGDDQVSIFMDMLNEGGYQLDIYSILYYTDLLRNGPMRNSFFLNRGMKRYFTPMADVMITLADFNKSPSNTSIISNDAYQMGCGVHLKMKIPPMMENTLKDAIPLCEEMFRSSMKSSTVNDNTLPLVDKQPENRCNSEPSGKWPLNPNGNYMVKDIDFYNIVEAATPNVLKAGWDYMARYQQTDSLFKPDLAPPFGIGPPNEENARVWKAMREYNPFKKETPYYSNTNTKTIVDGLKISNIEVDLLGEEIESLTGRGSALKISNDEKDVEYKLHTNTGQLGS